MAAISLDVVCEALGCAADFGPAYLPDDRPFIERFFGTVTAILSRRLPGVIRGKDAAQVMLKRLRDPADSFKRLAVDYSEIEKAGLFAETAIRAYRLSPDLGGGPSSIRHARLRIASQPGTERCCARRGSPVFRLRQCTVRSWPPSSP